VTKAIRRRGRVVSSNFMAFVRRRGCILLGKHTCCGPVTFHHVRSHGSPKDDTWGIGLCAFGHLIDWNSRTSIEALGKAKFEELWGISIAAECERNRGMFQKGQ
jgi:hypothetical protein